MRAHLKKEAEVDNLVSFHDKAAGLKTENVRESMIGYKLLQVRIPTPVKRVFDHDCILRGLSRAEVVQFLLAQEVQRIESGAAPSYAGLVPRSQQKMD